MQELIQEEVSKEMKVACRSRADSECKPRAKLLLSSGNYPKDMLKVKSEVLERGGGKYPLSRRNPGMLDVWTRFWHMRWKLARCWKVLQFWSG